MKNLLLAAAAATATLVLPAVLQARDDGIIVQSQRAAKQVWVTRISRNLDWNLRNQAKMGDDPAASGAVSVRFTSAPDGRATDLSVVRASGDQAVDQAAMKVVSRLKSLQPLPDGISANQRFRADIIYASNHFELIDLARDLARDHAAMAKARPAGEAPDLVLTASGSSEG